LSPVLEKSIAKHEIKCDIFDIMSKTAELLKKRGRAYFIFSASREEDFRAAVRSNNLRIRTWRYVLNYQQGQAILLLAEFNYQQGQAILLLAECNFRAKKEIILPPLILYDKKGNYTQEAEEIFSGRDYAPAA